MEHKTPSQATSSAGGTKLAYVAGPYRDPRGVWYVTQNIGHARLIAGDLWARGYAAVCPHLNTALFGGLVPDEAFLEGALELMRRCDVVVASPYWHQSEGTRAGLREALTLHIPIYPWPHLDEASAGIFASTLTTSASP